MSHIGDVRQLLANGRRREALRLAEELVSQGGGPAAVAIEARARLHCGEPSSATGAARAVLTSAGASAEAIGEARYVLATAALQLGDYDESIAAGWAFLDELHRYPVWRDHRATVYYHLGMAERRRGRVAVAINHYETAIDLGDPRVTESARVNRAWAHVILGRTDLADADLARVAQSSNRDVQIGAELTRAYALVLAGSPDAMPQIYRVLATRPPVTGYWAAECSWLLAMNSAQRGDREAALGWITAGEGHAKETRDADLLHRLAQVRQDVTAKTAVE